MRENIEGLNKKFIQKELSATKILENCQKRITDAEPKIHALLTLSEKEAKEDAKKADERINKGQRKSVLDGTVATIKDVFCTKNLRTTASSKMLDNFIPPFDATVVERLKEAGVVIVGKNNCDAWAHGASTENSDYGVTNNPWDLTRVSGGNP
jgi:aspartyl-tRNA(Asn)/glutamyl-tRNA(Gln) amidotransferase subunit A